MYLTIAFSLLLDYSVLSGYLIAEGLDYSVLSGMKIVDASLINTYPTDLGL